jgi:lysophospholipase L1-like esterase
MSYSEYLKNKAIEGKTETGSAVESVAGKTGEVTLVKADVGLSNVDNTSDVNKPISTATQTALTAMSNAVDGVADDVAQIAQDVVANTNAISSLNKESVGLSNVDNTSDVDKPISTATQTALNSKQNTLTAGPNITISSNIISYVSGVPPKTAGLNRYMGGAATSTGSTVASTSYTKFEAEAPFSRVRLHFYSKEAAALANIKAVVASTEVASVSTVNNITVPIVNGTNYNVAHSAAAANMYGFRTVTFGGASTGTIPAGTVAVPGELVSDWIECQSVTPTTGSRPFLLVRHYADPATNSSTISFGSTTYNQNWQTGSAQPYFRQYYPIGLTSSDGVGTLTNLPAATTIGGGRFIGVEFDYTVPCRSVLAVGDSLTEGGGYQPYGYDNWILRAVNTKSTPTAPLQCFNGGLSSQTQTSFMTTLTNLINNGASPTDIVIPNWSINNTSTTTLTRFHTGIAKAQILTALQDARRVGARVYLWTSYHRPKYTAFPNAIEAFDELQTWTRNLCATGAATLIDVAAGWNDATHLGVDAIHPNPAGIQYMADLLTAKL